MYLCCMESGIFIVFLGKRGLQETVELGWPAFLTRFRNEAAQTGMNTRRATEGSAGMLDSTSKSRTEPNAVDG